MRTYDSVRVGAQNTINKINYMPTVSHGNLVRKFVGVLAVVVMVLKKKEENSKQEGSRIIHIFHTHSKSCMIPSSLFSHLMTHQKLHDSQFTFLSPYDTAKTA